MIYKDGTFSFIQEIAEIVKDEETRKKLLDVFLKAQEGGGGQ